jgi:hypothetical protein
MRRVQALAETKEKGGFFSGFGSMLDEFGGAGRRYDKWKKDFRPDDEKGKAARPSETSQLSWGGAKTVEMYKEMADQFEKERTQNAADTLADQPLGSAAVSIVGESAKGDDSEAYEVCQLADQSEVPDADSTLCQIDGPVELAELVRRKYGRYNDISVAKATNSQNEVVLSVYASFLGQSSFPFTEEQWLQKLNNIHILLQDLNQEWYVKKFLLTKAMAVGGRWKGPTDYHAITLRLSDSPTWNEARDSDIFDGWMFLKSMQ